MGTLQQMKITDYLAIYAAALSTIVFVWNVFQSQPRFRIDLVFGVETKNEKTEGGVYIIVRNVSNHDIHLASIGFLYLDRQPSLRERISYLWKFKRVPRRLGWVHSSLSYHAISNGCPTAIEARKSHRVFVPISAIETMIAKGSAPLLIASAQDELWNNVYTRPFNCSFALKE
ncbi:MAG: hypothetical protein KME45_21175 [Stenomitos rutilans HA7619-LM2]|nr:hypothetical protein [Stenomitos rutilans HA7619-LM2]